jgi:choline dehydrogenase
LAERNLTVLMSEPDYIIVGSGAGGGPLAARLVEAGHRVLIIEAGGTEESWNYKVPVFHGSATEDVEMRLDHFVRHYEDEVRQEKDPKYLVERDAGRNGVYYPRARSVGGCTTHYAMIIIRPHDSDWDTIRQDTGDLTWAPREMDKYFARVEHWQERSATSSGHGKDGWLPTRFADVISLVRSVVRHHDPKIGEIVKHSVRANFKFQPIRFWNRPWLPLSAHFKAIFDPNDLRVLKKHGFGAILVPMAIDEKGFRRGPRERLYAAREAAEKKDDGGNLEIRTHCHVTEILFDEADPLRAVGVSYLPGEHLYRADRDPSRFGEPTGASVDVRAKREVIISAGAYITPQLLMLSGIGPREELERHHIKVRLDRPGVGENLQDRYEVGIVAQTEAPFGLLANATFAGPVAGVEMGDEYFEQWRLKGRGLYATNGAVIGFTATSSVAENGEPDLFIFGVPGAFVGYYTGWSPKAIEPPRDSWTWLLLKGHARFRGRVTLNSADPLDPPHVDFNYFPRDKNGELTTGAKLDLHAMREGVALVNKLLKGTTGHLNLHKEVMKGVDLETDAGVDQFIQDRAWGHHASCTCKIGSKDDEYAVLDSSFRVHGTKNLRVVDASVFPRIPGFFVVMPIYMISEKAADAILADAKK